MKANEKPILFSGAMIRALIAGQKTQTRRIIKPQPPKGTVYVEATEDPSGLGALCISDADGSHAGEFPPDVNPWRKCPYGQPGDRLWVREDFRAKSWSADGGWGEIEYRDGRFRLINGAPWSFADAYPQKHPVDRWRSARFMPRWASRLLLEIVSVRVERLNNISEEDAKNPWVWVVEFKRAGAK